MEKTRDCLTKLCGLTADADNLQAVLNAGLMKPVITTLLDTESDRNLLDLALRNLHNLSQSSTALQSVQENKALVARLELLSRGEETSAEGTVLVQAILAKIEGSAEPDAENAHASHHAGDVQKTKAITISMRGLLGDREVNNAYTQALLVVHGVVSVTIDPKHERVVIYTRRADEIRHQLVNAIESVKQRYGLSSSKAAARQPLAEMSAAYLDDEDEDDFLGEGTITERTCETVEQRLARKRQDSRSQQRVRKRDVLYGAVSSLFKW